jgi:hypothetical protein
LCGDRSAIAPVTGSTNTVRNTDSETVYGNSEPGAMSRPSTSIVRPRHGSSEAQPAPALATAVRYGPRKTVTTVVENAEFAQS